MRQFDDPAVQHAYASFPDSHRPQLTKIRELILEVADALDLPGGIRETLKWGEPSYLPVKPRTGTTVRTGSFDASHVAVYFNCQTLLVERFRSMFGNRLAYSKNRAVLFGTVESLPENEIRTCLRMALRYHLDKLPATTKHLGNEQLSSRSAVTLPRPELPRTNSEAGAEDHR